MSLDDVLGEYPFRIESRDDKTAVLFYPKKPDALDPNSPVLTLFFNFTDDSKRNRLKAILNELSTMG